MNLVRRMEELHDGLFSPVEQEFNRFFNEFWGNKKSLDKMVSLAGYPKMDVNLGSDCFIIKTAVPGVNPNDLKVEVIDGVVSISGEMEHKHKDWEGFVRGETHSYITELHKGKFERSITLPEEVDQTKDPTAEFNNGILTLKWARKFEDKKNNTPKLIQIKTT